MFSLAANNQTLSILPPLREDLSLEPGPQDLNGRPSWTLHDPAANRFFRIGWTEYELLSRWSLINVDQLIDEVTQYTPLTVTQDTVERLVTFLDRNNLLRRQGPQDTAKLLEQRRKADWSLGKLARSYLSLKLPLFNPDALLNRTRPLWSLVFHPWVGWLTITILLLSLYLIGRRFDEFVGSAVSLLTPSAWLWFGLSLILAKIAHEFGHAIAAKRYGVRVHSMGVALIVFWPVLFTDVSDAWRLSSRRQRLLIGSAGMVVELAIAAYAGLAWALLPASPLRDVCFFLAGTAWLTTLFVNLNPLMRFDGYFLLADLWRVENLQPRAAALLRWWWRRRLFGIDEPSPETLAQGLQKRLIIYGLAVAVYRVFIVLVIALLVYSLVFKALGILLLAMQVTLVILWPLIRELFAVFKDRAKITSPAPILRTVLAMGCVVAVLIVPWYGRVSVPAFITPVTIQPLFVPVAGKSLDTIAAEPRRVQAGTTLLQLSAPNLDQQLNAVAERRRGLVSQLNTIGADRDRRAQRLRLESQIAALDEQAAGLQRSLDDLTVSAPATGIFVPAGNDLIRENDWLNADGNFGWFIGDDGFEVQAFLNEQQIGRLADEATARFYPMAGGTKLTELELISISPNAIEQLAHPFMADRHGGPIAVTPAGGADNNLQPKQALFSARFRVPDENDWIASIQATDQPVHQLGQVLIATEPVSIATEIARRFRGLLLRELAF